MRFLGILLLLLSGLILHGQVSKQKQYSVGEAKDYNLLLSVTKESKEYAVVFVDTTGGMAYMKKEPSYTHGISTKDYLPGFHGLVGYGNISVVDTEYGKAFLTAYHCLHGKGKPGIDRRMLATFVPEYVHKERDLHLMVLRADSFESLKSVKISKEKVLFGDTCSFGFIHNFYDIQWGYRNIKGPIVKLTRKDKKNLFMTRRDAQKIVIVRYGSLLEKVSKNKKRKFLKYSSRKILEGESKYKKQVRKYGFLCMEIPKSVYRELPGSSGSALLNKKGDVVGVTSFVWPGKGKYYVFFSPTYVLNE